MKIQILNTPEVYIPKQGTETSSGFDIIAVNDPKIVGKSIDETTWASIDYIQYRTGLYIAPEDGYDTIILPRSSISKYNLVLANSVGLVDNDYRGEILLRFKYIYQPKDLFMFYDFTGKLYEPQKLFGIKVDQSKIYNKGDKIGQLKFGLSHTRIFFELVDELSDTHRGDGAFGHTDE